MRASFCKNTPSTLRKVLFFDRFRRVEVAFYYFCKHKKHTNDYREKQGKGENNSGVSI